MIIRWGGDAWEEWGGANRFLSVALPCAWALIAASVVGLVARTPLAGRLAGAAGGLALLAGNLNFCCFPHGSWPLAMGQRSWPIGHGH